MELKMNDYQLPEKISFNFEEIKAEIAEKVNVYSTLVYTEEQIKDAKADRAKLNKFKTVLEDRRKEIKKQCLTPYAEFERQVKEIVAVIDKPISMIDTQIKEFDEIKKEEKKAAIVEIWEKKEKTEWLTLDNIFNAKWLNKTVTLKAVETEIDEKLEQIKSNLEMLSNLPEFGFEATEVYKTTLDVNKAINEAQRMSQIAKAKAEAEERRRQEEQARKEIEFMNPPVDDNIEGQVTFNNPYEFDRIVEEAKATQSKQWITFKALLSTDDALLLRNFFNENNIEFGKA